MFGKRKPECNYDKEVLAAASLVMWDALRDLRTAKEITPAQHAAWCSDPSRDCPGTPNN